MIVTANIEPPEHVGSCNRCPARMPDEPRRRVYAEVVIQYGGGASTSIRLCEQHYRTYLAESARLAHDYLARFGEHEPRQGACCPTWSRVSMEHGFNVDVAITELWGHRIVACPWCGARHD